MSKAKKLTDLAVRNLKPRSQPYRVADGGDGGAVVVQPSGRRSYILHTRIAGRQTKLTFDGEFSLAAARAWKAGKLLEISRGGDPVKAKKQAKQAEYEAAANSFRAVCEEYFKREGYKLRSVKDRRSSLERLFYPTLGDRPIAEIKRKEIKLVLDKIEDGALINPKTGKKIRGGRVMRDRAMAYARRVTNWWAVEDEDYVSPFVRGMARTTTEELARDRTLSDDEVRKVWAATDKPDDEFAALVRFLLLTGARRSEAANMRWSETTGTDWTLPAVRNKVKLDFIRPLSKAALEVIEAQPRYERTDFIFTKDGRTALSGFSYRKAAFDKACGVSNWRLHDLRRTARSLMSRAGISVDHAEIAVGHKLKGVRGTYDRHSYHDEKKRAFEALASLIERIVDPPASNNVREFRGRR